MVNYWDYRTTSTTGESWTTTTGTANTWNYYVTQVVRKMLVESPEHWSKDDVAAFVRLVNDETSTGWKVTMVINGDVDIVDYSIETRDMDSFRLLLRQQASAEDMKTIDAFFDEHHIIVEED